MITEQEMADKLAGIRVLREDLKREGFRRTADLLLRAAAELIIEALDLKDASNTEPETGHE